MPKTQVFFRKYIRSLRKFRAWHRLLGITLSILLVISAATGILLSLKKDIEIIQPPTQKGMAEDFSQWLPISTLDSLARTALYLAHPAQEGNPIDRFDLRPSKGIAKVIFENHQWEVQLDASTGEVKSIARRHSDWIEALHDGSIVNDLFKLISMNFLGFGLLFLITTGLWLWYGPKRLRYLKRLIKKRRSKQ